MAIGIGIGLLFSGSRGGVRTSSGPVAEIRLSKSASSLGGAGQSDTAVPVAYDINGVRVSPQPAIAFESSNLAKAITAKSAGTQNGVVTEIAAGSSTTRAYVDSAAPVGYNPALGHSLIFDLDASLYSSVFDPMTNGQGMKISGSAVANDFTTDITGGSNGAVQLETINGQKAISIRYDGRDNAQGDGTVSVDHTSLIATFTNTAKLVNNNTLTFPPTVSVATYKITLLDTTAKTCQLVINAGTGAGFAADYNGIFYRDGQEAHSISMPVSDALADMPGHPVVLEETIYIVKTSGSFDNADGSSGGVVLVIKGREGWRETGAAVNDRWQVDLQGHLPGRGATATLEPATTCGYYSKAGASTPTQATQVRGPFIYQLQGTAAPINFKTRHMSTTPNAGTIDLKLNKVQMLFDRDQSATLGNGSRITIAGSTAEFVLSSFVATDATNASHSTAIATRSGSVLGTTAYTYGATTQVVQEITGICSQTQAGATGMVVGELLGVKDVDLPLNITAFDGTTGLTLTPYVAANTSGGAVTIDRTAQVYSTIHDGFVEHFINGTLVVCVKKGFTNALVLGEQSNTGQVWCNPVDLACMSIATGLSKFVFVSLCAIGLPAFKYYIVRARAYRES